MAQTADLGWVIARIKTNNQGQINELCLVCPSDASGSVFSPAQSITIYSVEAVDALRNLLLQEAP